MAYGIKYNIPFRSATGTDYVTRLLLKDYTGAATVLEGGPAPFILNYQSGDDEIINAIRASEATIQFYNDGLTPLSEFYSDNDNEWKVEFYSGAALLWAGFVVQDSCRESFIDPPYLVQLRATDNIGLLKDIPFDEGYKRAGFKTEYFNGNSTVDATTPGQLEISVPADDKDTQLMNYISSGGADYLIISASYPATTQLLLRIEPAAPVGVSVTDWIIYASQNPLNKLQLSAYLQAAYVNTGLLLPLQIFSNLFENTEQDRGDSLTADMFSAERLSSAMFLNEDTTWKNLYEVLESILMPLNATFLQVGGKWVVIRQTELKQFSNAIPGTAYDPATTLPVAVTLNPVYNIAINGDNIFLNADAMRAILRPFKMVKHTFDYEPPKELIKNINLNVTGRLLTEYTFDPGGPNEELRREYELPFWTPLFTGLPDTPFIFLRTVYEIPPGGTDEVEQDRYICIFSGGYGGPWLQSSAFYINVGDRVNVSFQLRTAKQNIGSGDVVFTFQTDTGTQQYKINWNISAVPNGTWTTTGGAQFEWATSPDTREWTTFSVQSLGCPVAGYFSIMLSQVDNNPGGETHYKDFQVDYFGYINGSLRIKGQYHKQELTANIKNVRDENILIDDSPKQVYKGALLTSAATAGDFITLTTFWHRGAIAEARRLGEIATLERAQMQSKPRAIIEGTIYFQDQPTPLNVFRVDSLPGLNLIPGVMEVNYMAAVCNLKLWEIYATGETDAVPSYRFNYIKELS